MERASSVRLSCPKDNLTPFHEEVTMLSAAEVMRLLDLKPHPEGGHYHQTFRDSRMVEGARAASTAIYFLLARGERSHWHKVDAVEVWHYHAGAPLKLEIAADAEGPVERVTLGADLAAGERPQAIVPAHAWQAAQSLGEWTLVGCTVAPGFEFSTFELALKGWAPAGAT
jgi:predicted cupin superfamily sugar epimerase